MKRPFNHLVALGCATCLLALVVPNQTSSGTVAHRADLCGEAHQQTLFADTGGSLYAISLPSGKVAWRSRLPGPAYSLGSLTVPVCGHTGYVVVWHRYETGSGRLIPFSTSNGRLGRPIAIGVPGQVAVSPNGRTAYVANSGVLDGLPGAYGTTITPVNLAAGRALRPISLPGQPAGIALFEHGAKLLVSLMDRNGEVVPVTTRTGKVGPPVTFPPSSYGDNTGGPLVVDPAYGLAFEGNLGQDLVSPAPIVNVVNLRTMAAEQPISLGYQVDAAVDLAVSNTGGLVFVACPRGVAAINVPARTAAPNVPNTTFASNVVTSLNGRTVYVARGFSGNIVISMPYLGTSVSNVTNLGGTIRGIAVGMR